ncbi:MAG: winged helix-turn-helix transcriptional regulator [Chloroflexota bacterium]|nr:winged helix-turn-helix transcriptional regulator [Chloroflexota bacterium]
MAKAGPGDAAAVQQVRRFNRTVAERIGALNDRFLGRARPYAESRVLWEIGPEGVDVRSLRARLGLDSGYTSRLLRSLERQGLATVNKAPGDGRVRRVGLTRRGDAERAQLDRRSDAVAWSFLEPLGDAQRARLVAAMTDVERLLQASLVRFAVEDPTSADARWCIEQYFAELAARFESGFDPALTISAAAHELVPPAGALVIARLRDHPVGCGAIKFHPGAPAELKRMWLAPEVRGLGLGRRLLLELEQRAREAGARVLRLETNRALTEALALYRSTGYREVDAFNDEPYAHHWFEKRLS